MGPCARAEIRAELRSERVVAGPVVRGWVLDIESEAVDGEADVVVVEGAQLAGADPGQSSWAKEAP